MTMATVHGDEALLLDFDMEANAVHKARLEADGYTVTLVVNADAALAFIEKTPPAIVFVETRPKASAARDFIQALRVSQFGLHIPVIILRTYLAETLEKKGLHSVRRDNW